MFLSPPPVARTPEGWKSSDKTGSHSCRSMLIFSTIIARRYCSSLSKPCSKAQCPHPSFVAHLPHQRGNTEQIDHRQVHIPLERAREISSRALTKKDACLTQNYEMRVMHATHHPGMGMIPPQVRAWKLALAPGACEYPTSPVIAKPVIQSQKYTKAQAACNMCKTANVPHACQPLSRLRHACASSVRQCRGYRPPSIAHSSACCTTYLS